MQQSADHFDLADLNAFIALAETGSFAAASKRLLRDPTAVSRRVSALEARLGVRLAERSTRHVHLTEAGRGFLERVGPILADLRAAEAETASLSQGEPRGHIRVALPSAFGRLWIAPAIPEFLKQYPAVTVEARLSNDYVDVVGEGFDLAVRLGALPDSRLVARKVATRRRLLCASPDYLERRGEPGEPDELVAHDCLRFTGKQNPFVWEFVKNGREAAVPITGPLESDDPEVLLAGGLGGLGIVFATDWLVGRAVSEGRLVRLLSDWQLHDEGAVYLVMPSRSGLPSKTRAFADWLAAYLDGEPWNS
jgi:DNA-binding transcriptional LysR family regulator